MMSRRQSASISLALVLAAAGMLAPRVRSQEPSPPGTLVSLDPRFDALVPKTAKLEKLADGFQWVEGPVWDQKVHALLFSDIPNNVVHRWKQGEGLSEFLRPSGVLARQRGSPGPDTELIKPMPLRDCRSDERPGVRSRAGKRLEIDVRGQVLLSGICEHGGIFVASDGLEGVAGSASVVAIIH